MTLCGGSSASTDRRETLRSYGMSEDTFKKLNDLSSSFGKTGSTLRTAGAADTAGAAKYFSDILSGDPAKVMEAAAPEINAMADQADAQKRQIAQTGNRSGGTNAITQGISSDVRGQTGNIIAGQRGEAAKGLERIGESQTREGLAAEGLGLSAETAAGSTASNLGNLSAGSRATSQQIHDAAVQQWADVASTILLGL